MKPQCGVTRAQQNGGGGGRYVVIKHTKMKRGENRCAPYEYLYTHYTPPPYTSREMAILVLGSAHTVEKRGKIKVSNSSIQSAT